MEAHRDWRACRDTDNGYAGNVSKVFVERMRRAADRLQRERLEVEQLAYGGESGPDRGCSNAEADGNGQMSRVSACVLMALTAPRVVRPAMRLCQSRTADATLERHSSNPSVDHNELEWAFLVQIDERELPDMREQLVRETHEAGRRRGTFCPQRRFSHTNQEHLERSTHPATHPPPRWTSLQPSRVSRTSRRRCVRRPSAKSVHRQL